MYEKKILTLLILVILLGVYFAFNYKTQNVEPIINNNLPTATYINTTAEKIIVATPYPGAVTAQEFSVLGEAAGWYFEASFPVEVRDPSNNILWQGPAQALSDWMTADLVAFKADVKITNGYTGPATLILRKDNPSGEPANDASMSMPINISY